MDHKSDVWSKRMQDNDGVRKEGRELDGKLEGPKIHGHGDCGPSKTVWHLDPCL